jgi:hypothetical protein
VFNAIVGAVVALFQAFSDIITGIFGAIADVVSAFAGLFGALISGAINLVVSLFEGLGRAIGGIFGAIGDIVKGVASLFSDVFNGAIKAVVSIFESLGKVVVGIFKAIGGVVKAFIKLLVEIVKLLRTIIELASQAGGSLGGLGGFGGIGGGIIKGVKKLFGKREEKGAEEEKQIARFVRQDPTKPSNLNAEQARRLVDNNTASVNNLIEDRGLSRKQLIDAGVIDAAQGGLISGPVTLSGKDLNGGRFQQGGLIRSDTLIGNAVGNLTQTRNLGLAGEAGEEFIVPAVRTPGGDLGIKAVAPPQQGGSGGPTVINKFQIDARGAGDEVIKELRAMVAETRRQTPVVAAQTAARLMKGVVRT